VSSVEFRVIQLLSNHGKTIMESGGGRGRIQVYALGGMFSPGMRLGKKGRKIL
jgi:hypothetical protein